MKNATFYSNSLGGFWKATGIDTDQVKSGIEAFMGEYDQSQNFHNSYMKYRTSNEVESTFSWMCSLKIVGTGEDDCVKKEYGSLTSFLK